jgi:flagellar basal body-associated protein FliL
VKRKKVILAILIILLILSLLGIFLWYFNIYEKNSFLKKEYPFLTSFEKEDISVSNSKYKAEALIYKIRISEDSILFDANILEPNTNTYLRDVTFPVSSPEAYSYLQQHYLNKDIYSVVISVDVINKKFFSKPEIKWSIENVSFSHNEIEQINKDIETNLKQATNSTNDQKPFYIYSSYFYLENNEIRGIISNTTSDILFRPLLWSYNKTVNKEDVFKYLMNFYDYKKNALEKNGKDSNIENVTPYSCTIVERIIRNLNITGENRSELLAKYCNINDLEEVIKKRTTPKFDPENYNVTSLINSIIYQRVISAQEEKFPLAFDWYISFSSDVDSAERLYNQKISFDNGDVLGRISSSIINNNTFTLRNMCKIAEYIDNKEIKNSVLNLFKTDTEESLKLIDTDMFSSLYCLNNIEDKEYVTTILFKIYKQKFESRNGLTGLWNKDRYLVEGNSIFLMLLNNYYEEI